MEKIIEQYNIKADGINVEIKITGDKERPQDYKITLSSFTKPTLALLDQIKTDLLKEVSISAQEILEPKAITELKERFRKKAIILLEACMPGIREESKHYLAGRLMQEML